MPRKPPVAKQQGKPYTQEQKQNIIKSMKPYFMLGYDLKNACILAGVTYMTVWGWIKKDTSLLIQIQAWQNSVSAKARENIATAIKAGDTNESKWWLERRDKASFSPRTEIADAEIESDEIDELLKKNNLL